MGKTFVTVLLYKCVRLLKMCVKIMQIYEKNNVNSSLLINIYKDKILKSKKEFSYHFGINWLNFILMKK